MSEASVCVSIYIVTCQTVGGQWDMEQGYTTVRKAVFVHAMPS